MTLRAIVARHRRTAHRGALGMARGDRWQIEAVGLDDAPGLLVPTAIALAVGAVFYRDDADRDRATVGFLDLPA